MYPICAPVPNIWVALADLDHRMAIEVRSRPCSFCGGPLHWATWLRKPRGADLPEALTTRWGLCCGRAGCRQRTLPPSALFNGRRVYLKAVVLLVVAARQPGRIRTTMARLTALFGASADTARRWVRALAEGLSDSADWRRVRGRVPPTVRDVDVPRGLLDALLATSDAVTALVTACRWVPAL